MRKEKKGFLLRQSFVEDPIIRPKCSDGCSIHEAEIEHDVRLRSILAKHESKESPASPGLSEFGKPDSEQRPSGRLMIDAQMIVSLNVWP